MRVGLLSDEYDAHGLSLFFFGLKNNFNYVDVSLLNFEYISRKLETLANASSLYKLDVAIVADLPIDMKRPDEVIQIYAKVVPFVGRLVFLDHHPTSRKFKAELVEVGVLPVITNGIGMSIWIYEFARSGKFLLLEGMSDEDIVRRAVQYVDDPLFHILLYGNFADMDYSAALLMRLYPEIGNKLNEEALGFDVLTRIDRLAIAKFSPRELIEVVSKVVRGIKEGSIRYPPAIYAEVVRGRAKVIDQILVYIFEHEFPMQWLNRTIAYIMNTNNSLRYAIVASSGRDERSGKDQTLICIYARWYDIDQNLTEVTEKIVKILNEETGLKWFNFGHKTFSCVATEKVLNRETLTRLVEIVLNQVNYRT